MKIQNLLFWIRLKEASWILLLVCSHNTLKQFLGIKKLETCQQDLVKIIRIFLFRDFMLMSWQHLKKIQLFHLVQ